MQCLIKNSEYWTKLAQSGIPESVFYPFANAFTARHGRFPNLDEMPNANSSKHLKDLIHLKDSAKVSDILASTNTKSIQEANVVLNDMYTDLEVELFPLNEESLVDIKNRPSQYNVQQSNVKEIANIPSRTVFLRMFDKLRKLYGININSVTSEDIQDIIPENKIVNAFIKDGNIFVNTDFADIDAPIHEMTHILLGSIRFKNSQLYEKLVSFAQEFPNFEYMATQFPNKTRLDILEEIFVQESAKYFAGMDSQLNLLPENILFEIQYNVKRLLDSALMGQYSVKSIPDADLYNMSWKELVKTVNSDLIHNDNLGSLDDAALHRMLSNAKSEMLKNGDLREDCV